MPFGGILLKGTVIKLDLDEDSSSGPKMEIS